MLRRTRKMLDRLTQEKLLNSYITAVEVAELINKDKDVIYRKLKKEISDQRKCGNFTLFYKEDVHNIFKDVAAEHVDKDQARREVLSLAEASKIVGRPTSTLRNRTRTGELLNVARDNITLVTLSSLLQCFTPSYSTRTDKLLSPLVAKHIEEDSPNVYVYLDKKLKLCFTDQEDELTDNALYSCYLGNVINKNVSYVERMALLRRFVGDWIQLTIEDYYNALYAR